MKTPSVLATDGGFLLPGGVTKLALETFNAQCGKDSGELAVDRGRPIAEIEFLKLPARLLSLGAPLYAFGEMALPGSARQICGFIFHQAGSIVDEEVNLRFATLGSRLRM